MLVKFLYRRDSVFYCGIDIAKYKHEAAVVDAEGKALLDSVFFKYQRRLSLVTIWR